MVRYKRYDYDQLMMVPVSLEEQLMPGTLEYAIHHVVEERLDLSMFDDRYCNDDTGRKAIDPKVLIKIVLFGYSRGLVTSRSWSEPVRKILHLWLFHAVRSLTTAQLRPLFRQWIKRLNRCLRKRCWFAGKRVC